MGNTGRSTSFEVKVNGTLIFSKLKMGGFPVFEEIAKAVQEAAAGGSPGPVTNTQPSSCAIL